MCRITFLFVVVLVSSAAVAGPYTEAGIYMDDANIVSWAVDCNVIRGYIDITNHQMISDNNKYQEVLFNEKSRLVDKKWKSFYKW